MGPLRIPSHLGMGYHQLWVGGKMPMFCDAFRSQNIYTSHSDSVFGRVDLKTPLTNTKSVCICNSKLQFGNMLPNRSLRLMHTKMHFCSRKWLDSVNQAVCHWKMLHTSSPKFYDLRFGKLCDLGCFRTPVFIEM